MTGDDGMELVISADGSVQAVYDDNLRDLFPEGGETFRASHVEPSGGQWTADLSPVGGPVLGPFGLRQAALDAEVAWLRERMAQGRLEQR